MAYEDDQFTYGSIPPCRADEVCREEFAMLSMVYSLEFRMTLRPILCGPRAALFPANSGRTAKLGGMVGSGA